MINPGYIAHFLFVLELTGFVKSHLKSTLLLFCAQGISHLPTQKEARDPTSPYSGTGDLFNGLRGNQPKVV